MNRAFNFGSSNTMPSGMNRAPHVKPAFGPQDVVARSARDPVLKTKCAGHQVKRHPDLLFGVPSQLARQARGFADDGQLEAFRYSEAARQSIVAPSSVIRRTKQSIVDWPKLKMILPAISTRPRVFPFSPDIAASKGKAHSLTGERY